MGSSSISQFGIVLLAFLAIVGIAFLVLLPRLLLKRKKPFKDPVCGYCRYVVAPNPNGLSICPECGQDYLIAGILAPGTRLPARLPAVVTPILWVLICAGVSFFTYRSVYPLVLKTITTTAMNETSTFPATGGVLDRLPASYDTLVEEAVSASAPAPSGRVVVALNGIGVPGSGNGKVLSSTLEVQFTPDQGAPLTMTIDPRTRHVTKTNIPGIAAGALWDAAAAKAVIADLKTRSGDTPTDNDEADVLAAVNQRLANAGKPVPNFGMISSFSTFGSTSISVPSGRSRTRTTSPTALTTWSSSRSVRTSSGSTQDVFIGPLRGVGWLIGFVFGGGGLMALLGLLWFVALNRRAP